jgi:hypothetical protein
MTNIIENIRKFIKTKKGKITTFIVIVLLLFIINALSGTKAEAAEISGSAVWNTILDKDSDNDLETSLDYLSFNVETDNVFVYLTSDMPDKDFKLYAEEAYLKFNFVGFDMKLGRQENLFGISYLFKYPENSPFITKPKEALITEGFSACYSDSLVKAEVFVSEDDYYTLRGTVNLFGDVLKPGISYHNGNSNAVFFATSKLSFPVTEIDTAGEWAYHNDYKWVRCALTPVKYAKVALLGGYYNNELIMVDSFVYGVAIKYNENVTFSSEWKITEYKDTFLPLHVRAVVTF